MNVRDTSPQCPYCPTVMLFLGYVRHEGAIEWLCPACKTTKVRTVQSVDSEPAPSVGRGILSDAEI